MTDLGWFDKMLYQTKGEQMVEFAVALKSAKDIDEAIGLIAKLATRLRGQPDLAAQKLGQALDEIGKTLQVVDVAASQYLSLGIDTGALEKGSQLLLQIQGGSLRTEVERGRGHCHVIGNIYWQYLDRWFQKALGTTDYQVAQQVFGKLGDADQDLFANLVDVTNVLAAEAREVLDSVVKGDVAQARSRVLALRAPLLPLQVALAETMQNMYQLKTQFIDTFGLASA